MKTVILLALLLTACALDIGSNGQTICLPEDHDNGSCGDPGGGSPPAEDPSLYPPPGITPAQLELETMTRDNAPSVHCEWDRCGDRGGYICRGTYVTCLLTRQGNVFCTTDPRQCFNTDLVCIGYQCPEWHWR